VRAEGGKAAFKSVKGSGLWYLFIYPKTKEKEVREFAIPKKASAFPGGEVSVEERSLCPGRGKHPWEGRGIVVVNRRKVRISLPALLRSEGMGEER